MWTRKRFSIFLLATGLSVTGFLVAHAELRATTPSAEHVEATSKKAVQTRRATQQIRDDWAAEEQRIREEIVSLQQKREDIKKQKDKTEAYIREEQEMIREQRRRLEMFKEIRVSLEPLLDESYEKLSRFVASDLPFLQEQRKTKLEAANHALYDYNASLADKAEPLFEALNQEVDYGSSIEVHEKEIKVKGLTRRVYLLRTGRIGMFALSLDRRKAWRWNQKQKGWEPLKKGWAHDINKAVEITDQQRVVNLVKLPFGVLSTAEEQP